MACDHCSLSLCSLDEIPFPCCGDGHGGFGSGVSHYLASGAGGALGARGAGSAGVGSADVMMVPSRRNGLSNASIASSAAGELGKWVS